MGCVQTDSLFWCYVNLLISPASSHAVAILFTRFSIYCYQISVYLDSDHIIDCSTNRLELTGCVDVHDDMQDACNTQLSVNGHSFHNVLIFGTHFHLAESVYCEMFRS